MWLEDGTLHVRREQDVEPILDNNKALQNTPQKTESFRHVGSVPNVIIEKWLLEDGAPILSMSSHEFGKFIRRKLNDPDWAHLRTFSGKL